MKEKAKQFHFLTTYGNLSDVLTDHNLASLGDAFINFVYSLALSKRKRKPCGAKVKGRVLAEAFKKADLRKHMPPRGDRHMFADAAEAFTVYAWLHHHVVLEEAVAMLESTDDPVEGLSRLLVTIKSRVRF